MTPCPDRCPCRVPHFDGERISVFSTGAFATLVETEPGTYAYTYAPATPQPAQEKSDLPVLPHPKTGRTMSAQEEAGQ